MSYTYVYLTGFHLLMQIGMSCFQRPELHTILIAPCISKPEAQKKYPIRPALCIRNVPCFIFGIGQDGLNAFEKNRYLFL